MKPLPLLFIAGALSTNPAFSSCEDRVDGYLDQREIRAGEGEVTLTFSAEQNADNAVPGYSRQQLADFHSQIFSEAAFKAVHEDRSIFWGFIPKIARQIREVADGKRWHLTDNMIDAIRRTAPGVPKEVIESVLSEFATIYAFRSGTSSADMSDGNFWLGGSTLFGIIITIKAGIAESPLGFAAGLTLAIGPHLVVWGYRSARSMYLGGKSRRKLQADFGN